MSGDSRIAAVRAALDTYVRSGTPEPGTPESALVAALRGILPDQGPEPVSSPGPDWFSPAA